MVAARGAGGQLIGKNRDQNRATAAPSWPARRWIFAAQRGIKTTVAAGCRERSRQRPSRGRRRSQNVANQARFVGEWGGQPASSNLCTWLAARTGGRAGAQYAGQAGLASQWPIEAGAVREHFSNRKIAGGGLKRALRPCRVAGINRSELSARQDPAPRNPTTAPTNPRTHKPIPRKPPSTGNHPRQGPPSPTTTLRSPRQPPSAPTSTRQNPRPEPPTTTSTPHHPRPPPRAPKSPRQHPRT